ncbi:ectonucleotide pyrophosphatase/phosphodiesterase [Eubacteriaceae bacterium ES3]|nr:ectonucleotide pyrophosphatase/phosphodiesterase [Eubacteriaceae bacterium ES3]
MNRELVKHLIVVSYDAFSEDNWESATKLPNLKKLIENGSWTRQLKSVYPTLTYVVHTTMVTGVYPEKHGIYHNNPVQPFIKEKNQEWFWYRNQIKSETIYDLVRSSGLKSGGLLWPVTGKAAIDYNIPEIRAINRENQVLKILRNGSPLYCISMEKKFGHIRKGIEEPFLDDYTTKCAIDTIIKKRPNLLLTHLIDLDDAKHQYGVNSSEVERAIERMDQRIGGLMKAVELAGIKEQTVFIIVGDHGQKDVKYKIKLNAILEEQGLIYKENEKMEWKAYFQSAGGSAYLYLKDNNQLIINQVRKILDQAIYKGEYGIEKYFDRQEMRRLNILSPAEFIIEAKIGYSFDDSLEGDIITDLEESGISYATHGYSPEKPDYRCNFIVSGNGIKKNLNIEETMMVDLAPTMARILGLELKNTDGRILDEIFEV